MAFATGSPQGATLQLQYQVYSLVPSPEPDDISTFLNVTGFSVKWTCIDGPPTSKQNANCGRAHASKRPLYLAGSLVAAAMVPFEDVFLGLEGRQRQTALFCSLIAFYLAGLAIGQSEKESAPECLINVGVIVNGVRALGTARTIW